MTQLSAARRRFPPLAGRLRDEDKRPGDEGKLGFYHPFPSRAAVGPHLADYADDVNVYVCVRACVFFLLCAGEVNQMCVSPS